MTRAMIAALAVLLAPAAMAVELSGVVRSSTGTLPELVQIRVGRLGIQSTVVAKVENGRYRIELPESGTFFVWPTAAGWDAAPAKILDPKLTSALDFLIYPAKVPEPELAAELIRLGEQDQAIRPGPSAKIDAETAKRMVEEDARREQRLAAIIDAKGWPTMSMVGHRAAKSAWLIAQHGSPAFLKHCLPLMKAAAQKGEIELRSLALSIDRDLMHDDKPQIYGSQLRGDIGGKVTLYPIADREHVDERRAAMGLEPLAQYLKHFEE